MNIKKTLYGHLPGGKEVHRFTLTNGKGMEVDIINYGGIVTSLRLPDRDKNPGDVVLGFDSLDAYLGGHPYFGAMVGRVCNRIGGARFELEGKLFKLTANEGNNQLHGGARGFDKVLWSVSTQKTLEQVSLVLAWESPDGDEGYPGNLLVEVEYFLNGDNELGIRCRAKSDKPTHVNLTNHSYFNLNNCQGNIHNHELFIDSDSVTELDGDSIPTGKILPVDGTAYDFRLATPIGDRIGQVEPGYDINYTLVADGELKRVAAVYDPVSGRSMEVLTTTPGIQLYTSNHIDQIQGKAGEVYEKHAAICLETQYYPDSCNHKHFPSTELKPGAAYDETTIYRFNW
jgi:aldose 1-epimerase